MNFLKFLNRSFSKQSPADISSSAKTLAISSILVQALALLASPLLTRIYSPEIFGVFALFGALTSAIYVVASLRLEIAIPLASSELESDKLTVLAIMGILVVSFFLTAALIVANSFGLAEFGFSIWWLSISCIVGGLYFVLEAVFLRKKSTATLAFARVALALLTITIQIFFSNYGVSGLIAGILISQATVTAILIFTFLRRFAFGLNINSSLKTTAKSNWRYCVYSTSEGLLNVAGVHLFSVAIFYFFGAPTAGQFFLASRISFVPVSLLGLAVAQAILAHAAAAESEGRLGEILGEITKKIVLVGIPLFFGLSILGPELISVIFGDSWREAGEYVRILTPSLFFLVLSIPVSPLLSLQNNQYEAVKFQMILMFARLAAMLFGVLLENSNVAIVCYAISSAICWYLLYYKFVQKGYADFAPTLVTYLRAVIATAIICFPTLLEMSYGTHPIDQKIHYWTASLFLGICWLVLIANDKNHKR